MAETLLSLLLVTTSATGANLVFRWPENPNPSPRLGRAPPDRAGALSLDDPWRASHPHESANLNELPEHNYGLDAEYAWPRPSALRDRSLSLSHSHRSLPTSASRDRSYSIDKIAAPNEYDHVLGYNATFLANILCPQNSMCHQKFELVVDDLAFIGHPVCSNPGGQWSFKPEKLKSGSRGRDSNEFTNSASPKTDAAPSMSPEIRVSEGPPSARSDWLTTFHFVLVLDLPDPSSSDSGNLSKYFSVLYEQIAFTLTAVLYQEQVLSNFVEKECDVLNSIKESCINRGEPYSRYVARAMESSSIAPAMKTLYDSIKSSSVAYLTINYLPLELQLPPFLDSLLHSRDDQDVDAIDLTEDGFAWGPEMGLGWKLPNIAPWKSLLLLDVDNDMDANMLLNGPYENPEDRNFAEGLLRFLETVTVTVTLNEMANLLDCDLEGQIYPIVRWLVLHRRARIVDTVHNGLRTVFTLPPKFSQPLPQLCAEFRETFSHPSIQPLPKILAAISASMSKQSDNHFFATVVKSKELLRMYHDVVVWMLKRNMLITLHIRIRIIATRELKMRVQAQRESKYLRYGGYHRRPSSPRRKHKNLGDLDEEDLDSGEGPGETSSFFLSPHAARRFTRRISSNESGKSELSELDYRGTKTHRQGGDSSSDSEELEDDEDSGWDTAEDHTTATIIGDPARATPMQRLWLSAMCEGKDPAIVKRFDAVNQYFDGKHSDDEIVYRADITRKQLREVLHHFEDYVQTFLHPS